MLCPKCHTEYAPDNAPETCPSCGTPLEEKAPVPKSGGERVSPIMILVAIIAAVVVLLCIFWPQSGENKTESVLSSSEITETSSTVSQKLA